MVCDDSLIILSMCTYKISKRRSFAKARSGRVVKLFILRSLKKTRNHFSYCNIKCPHSYVTMFNIQCICQKAHTAFVYFLRIDRLVTI